MEVLNGIWELFIKIVSGVVAFFNSFSFGSFTLLGLIFAFFVISILISAFWKGGA